MSEFDFKQLTLMVADSDTGSLTRVEKLFRGVGVKSIELAADQSGAMGLLQKVKPDLLMVDLRLEGMNGIPLIRKVRELAQLDGMSHLNSLPVLLTAQAISKHYMREACRAGIEGMVRKPYDPDRLVKLVRMAILRPRRFVVARSYFGPERRTGENPDYDGQERRTPPKRSEIYSPPPPSGIWPFEVADAPSLASPKAKPAGGKLVEDAPPKAQPVDPRLPVETLLDAPATETPRRKPEGGAVPDTELPARKEPEKLPDIELAARKKPEPLPVVEIAATQEAPAPVMEPAAPEPEPQEDPEEEIIEDEPEAEEQTLEEIPLEDALEDHKLWVNTGGREGTQVDFENADLRGADLERIDLTQSKLRMADFSGAQCMDAVFRKCDLAGSKFVESEMARANMAVARLSGADFTKANLEQANLLGADLTRANFRGASLRGSNFSGANLNGTDLRGVDLSAAQGLFIDQITRARISRNTRLPQGIKKR